MSDTWAGTDERWDMADAEVDLPASSTVLRPLFWDIRRWNAIWRRIDEVRVSYDDGVHQEFAMVVERDGHSEQVRTVRYRHDDGTIGFFSPDPPPSMAAHRGEWQFDVGPTLESSGTCRVRAVRHYRLRREGHETAAMFQDRREAYRLRFEQRLAAILQSFAEHCADELSAPLGAPSTASDV